MYMLYAYRHIALGWYGDVGRKLVQLEGELREGTLAGVTNAGGPVPLPGEGMDQHLTGVPSMSQAYYHNPVWLGNEALILAPIPGLPVLGSVRAPTCCVRSDHRAGCPRQLHRPCHLEGLPQGTGCQVADSKRPAGRAPAVSSWAADLAAAEAMRKPEALRSVMWHGRLLWADCSPLTDEHLRAVLPPMSQVKKTSGCSPICPMQSLLHRQCSQTCLPQQPDLVRPPGHCSQGLGQEGCNGNRVPAHTQRTQSRPQQCARHRPLPFQKS